VLEFIQAILSVVAKAVPAAIGQRRDSRLSEIGAELFLFYIQVNEALVCAEDIVSSLEVYVQRMSEHLATGTDSYALTAGGWITPKIARQCVNLAKIGETMQRWGRPLQIIDGESFAEIAVLLSGKRNALNTLLATMQARELPLSATAEELHALARAAQRAGRDEEHARLDQLDEAIRKDSVSLHSRWDPDVYRVVESYLRDRNPRQQVAQIRSVLEDIRSALEQNFSLTDVLMRVGDERFRVRYGGDYFF
jgi:hypothetical protein